MLLRIAVFAMLAAGIIGGGALAWVLLAAPPTPSSAVVQPVAKSVLLVAAHSLRAGSLVKPEDLARDERVTSDIPPGASLDTPQGRGNLTGSMVRRSMGEGQPILPADVVHPGDHGFLAAVLGPNMRAVTVSVDAVSGTAGLIWPGDRVDLILTQALDDPRLAVGRRVAAETVLTDARVIAVDQQIVQGQAPDGTVAPANRTATLEVTATQAERVLVAGRLGKLSLSVLAADRRDEPAGVGASVSADTFSPVAPLPLIPVGPNGSNSASRTGVTWAGDVSPALGDGEVRKGPAKVQVFLGGADSKEFNF